MRNRINIPLGLYGITGENFANGKTNFQCVEEMIKGGIKIIQYREKLKSHKEKLKEALELSKLCKENNVIFIVNDHVDIALLCDADGVHVGQDDIPPQEIRKLLGDDKIIGLSTHEPNQALAAQENIHVDYIGVGPLFPTTTKDTPSVGLKYLDFAVKNISIPFVAIGGIKEHNLHEVVSLGAKRFCLVSEIVGAKDINSKIKSLLNKS